MCHDVTVEPPLLPLNGELITPSSVNCSNTVRADIHARCFRGRRQSALFDVRVFHPNVPSYRQTRVASLFVDMSSRRSENMGTVYVMLTVNLSPHLFFQLGGFGKEATIFYNRLADLLSQNHNTSYNQTFSWMRCVLSFSLLRSTVLAIHGSRKLQSTELPAVSTELRLVESHIFID